MGESKVGGAIVLLSRRATVVEREIPRPAGKSAGLRDDAFVQGAGAH